MASISGSSNEEGARIEPSVEPTVSRDLVAVDIGHGRLPLIARLRDADGIIWLSLRQVEQQLIPDTARQSLINSYKRTGAKERQASTEDINFLYAHMAIKTKSRNVTLLQLDGVLDLLPGHRHTAAAIASMQQFASAPSSPLPPMLPAAGSANPTTGVAVNGQAGNADPHSSSGGTTLQHAGSQPLQGLGATGCSGSGATGPPEGSPSAHQGAAVTSDFPQTLPECTIPQARWSLPYSLSPRSRRQQPLKADIEAFKTWSTSAQQFNRPTGAVADSTMESVLTSLYLILGFMEHHLGLESPNLSHLLDADLFVQFLSFSVAKNRSIDSIKALISHTRKVLTWMGKTNPHTLQRVSAFLGWLDTVKKQLSMTIPKRKRDISALEDEGRWLEASELVQKVDAFEQDVRKEVGKEGGWEGDAPLSPELARRLHNLALVSCMFSHLPPLRLVCLRTLQMPLVDGCSKSDCRVANCPGNRLYYRDGVLRMLLSHYKVDKQWSGQKLDFKLPENLADILEEFMDRAHELCSPDCGLVFSRPDGTAMVKSDHLAQTWGHILRKELDSASKISPHMLRHIFVAERRSETRAPGPADASSAMIMANTTRQWDSSYDLNFRRREAQMGVDAMNVWRHHLLQRSGAGPAEVVLPGAAPQQEGNIGGAGPSSGTPLAVKKEGDEIIVDLCDSDS